MITTPKLEFRPAHPYAAIRTQVTLPFGRVLRPLWAEVHGWLAGRGITSPGPAIIRYLTTDMSTQLDMDVGFALDATIAGGDGITADILPAGRYATLLYTGPYKGKGVYKANVALVEWAKENKIVWQVSTRNNIEWWGSRVEWYLTDPDQEPDTKKYRTELTFLVADTP